MSGHEEHTAAEEDHSVCVKVGIFFVIVIVGLVVICMMN